MAAWMEGIKLHKKYFGKSFSKTQAEFMLRCLKTYCRSQYEFKKTPDVSNAIAATVPIQDDNN